ncbi:hypothetical protein AAG570_006355 [Ranatra chinensis]|uniref:Uncharacterized protein n=1 Tax=Ranatra chinensis TaxID=642074 RepID=A0ABD0YUE0_9HEMI
MAVSRNRFGPTNSEQETTDHGDNELCGGSGDTWPGRGALEKLRGDEIRRDSGHRRREEYLAGSADERTNRARSAKETTIFCYGITGTAQILEYLSRPYLVFLLQWVDHAPAKLCTEDETGISFETSTYSHATLDSNALDVNAHSTQVRGGTESNHQTNVTSSDMNYDRDSSADDGD